MNSEYLIFNLIVGISSTIGVSLYPGGVFPKIKKAFFSIFVVALLFIIWDELVTNNWWWFNSDYILGITLGHLPIEEILFFFSVPWSCLLLWENMKNRIKGFWKIRIEFWLMVIFLILAIFATFEAIWYTAVMCGVMIAVSLLSQFSGKWLRSKAATVFLCVALALTFVFNGYLTSRPVVLYSSETMTNIRVGSVPVEDFLYAVALLGSVVMIYEKLVGDEQG